MYTILITESNELVTTCRERIMQRSKLVDEMHFLADPTYKQIDQTSFTVLLEYILPVSKEYHSEILTLSDELYKDKLEYRLPFDTSLTKEAGDIEIQISFMSVDITSEGTFSECVRKTSSSCITIVPIAKWADYIPDGALSSLDQRILKQDAQIKALDEVAQYLYENQADDLSLEKDHLRLSSHGQPKGDGVHILVQEIDDGEIDGDSDGILDLDKIKFPDVPDTPDTDDNGFIEL